MIYQIGIIIKSDRQRASLFTDLRACNATIDARGSVRAIHDAVNNLMLRGDYEPLILLKVDIPGPDQMGELLDILWNPSYVSAARRVGWDINPTDDNIIEAYAQSPLWAGNHGYILDSCIHGETLAKQSYIEWANNPAVDYPWKHKHHPVNGRPLGNAARNPKRLPLNKHHSAPVPLP